MMGCERCCTTGDTKEIGSCTACLASGVISIRKKQKHSEALAADASSNGGGTGHTKHKKFKNRSF